MPPKRKRSAASVSEAPASSDSDSNKHSSFLETICLEWKAIATSKSRCTELWTNLVEPLHAPMAPEAGWLMLATHVMNRLVQHQPSPSKHQALCLAHLSYNVMTSLDRSKLDRMLRKPLVGRAILSATVASLVALETIKHHQQATTTETATAKQEDDSHAMWAAALALDTIVHTSQNSVKGSAVDGWHSAMAALSNQAGLLEIHSDIFQQVTESLKVTNEEAALLNALQQANTTATEPTSPTNKRRRSKSKQPSSTSASTSPSTSTSSPASPYAALEQLFAESVIDGRMSLRRWGSMAFVWLVKGQERLLTMCNDILQNGESWATLLECPSQKKTKKLAKCIHIPGNVAVVTFVTRLVAIAAEAAANGGTFTPSGGIDDYIQNQVLGTKSKKSSRPEIRDLCVVTIHGLIAAHAQCLTPQKLDNDDDDACAVIDGVAQYCPHVHKAIEALCRNAVASSPSVRKLLTLAACRVFQLDAAIMDAKLCSFAVYQFSHSLGCNDGSESFSLDNLTPLPAPVLSKKSRKKKKDAEDECTYAGLLIDLHKEGHLDKIILPYFFRSAPPDALYSKFLDVLEACYSPGPIKLKRLKKKKKTMEQQFPRRLNAIRAGLASDVSNALRACCTIDNSKVLRKFLTSVHACRFVRLSGKLDSILTTAAASESKKDSTASFFHPSASDFNLYERTLWSSHTNLCFVFGRGTLLHDGNRVEIEGEPLWSNEDRLAIVKEMAAGHDWPLHLHASHHALLTSNLTSTPIDERSEAEEFVASSLIDSIIKASNDVSLITHAKWYGDDGDLDRTTDERPPLSIRDGRLLLVAISRLPPKRQLDHVTTLSKAMLQLANDDGNPQVSQYLGRLVTVYAGLLNLVVVGTPLRNKLFDQVGPCQYQLPALYTVQNLVDGTANKEGNWYKRESCYMGLFSDWESPVVPSCEAVIKPLPKDIVRRTRDILERALTLGFEVADRDFGQLLFSAWNAAGRAITWDPSVSEMKIEAFDASNLARLFMSLRQDVCKVFFQLSSSHRSNLSDSLVGQTMKKMSTRRQSIKETLQNMLEKAKGTIDFLVEKKDYLSSLELALLEAIPIYIAFCMSMHTKTSETMFSRTVGKRKKRKRSRTHRIGGASGYDIELLASIMSDDDDDDDSIGSDDEDFEYQEGGDDCKIDALARLHDACNSFGAAPMHPDWLDEKCTFREGIHAPEAGRNASLALELLTKLGDAANAQHANAIQQCMASLAGKQTENSDTAAMLSCIAIDSANGMLSDCDAKKETDFQKAVATVFELPPLVVQDFYNDSAGTGWRAAKEAWIPNTPQQIVGVMQSQSIDGIEATNCEYRAGGEWEMLLSESLAGACTGCGMDDNDSNKWKSFSSSDGTKKQHVFRAYIQEERWLRISQGVVSQLMPTAALLRFAAAGGQGRETHPLCVVRDSPKGSIAATSSAERRAFESPPFSLPEETQNHLRNCLTFLACRSARSNGDEGSKKSCSAVATNLLLDTPQPFRDVEGIEALSQAFTILEAMRRPSTGNSTKIKTARAQLTESLLKMIQTRGDGPALSKVYGQEASKIMLLVAYLCADNISLNASILGITKVEPSHIIANESAERSQALGSLIHILIHDLSNRAIVATMLGEVADMTIAVTANPLPRVLMMTLQKLDDVPLKTLVEMAFASSINSLETVIGVCKILAYGLRGGFDDAHFCKKLYDHMQSIFGKTTLSDEAREHSLGLFYLYACRVSCLDAAGSSLMSDMGKNKTNIKESDSLVALECFLSFVQGVRLALLTKNDAMDINAPFSTNEDEASAAGATKPPQSPRACSHVLRNGFFQQHWYNCYTCGLVFDKGCCTICALKCHKGHEVTYSRYSSFFCDCGAEVESAGEQNRVVCKCIVQLPQEEANRLFWEDTAKSPLVLTHNSKTLDTNKSYTQTRRPLDLYINVASTFDASSEVENIKTVVSKMSWLRTIFELIADPKQQILTTSPRGIHEVHLEPAVLTKESVPLSLAARCGRPLILEPMETLNLVPVRAARAGTFNIKMSVDSTTDRLKRAMLTRHSIVRSVVVADSRGRLIVAEPCSLIFCSALPVVNTRYIEDALNNQAGRPQMSIVSTDALSFNIVGMSLNKNNERHLVVWGTSEASVVILKNKWCGVERSINLDFELDPHDCESDFLLKCEWIPGSQTHISVACGTFVKVYDISSAEGDDNVPPRFSYSITYEAVVKDIAWVSVPPITSGNKKPDVNKRKLSLFILTDTGKIHEIKLHTDSSGDIDEQGSAYLERSSRSIDIPTAGVFPYEGAAMGEKGSSTRSLGEGCSLHFLPRCRLLLYKCVSSCVVALSLSETGEVSGSFELLPNLVDCEIPGNDTESYSVVGPFTHWTEMGILEDGYFRLVCVGKSSRTNQPKMLCVDINEEKVKVKVLSWTAGGSVGLGLGLSSSFEGLAPFSAPVLSSEKRIVERLHLCAITSSGSALIYGEDMKIEPEGNDKQPIMPLTLYEELLNVSEVDMLKFTADGIAKDSDSIKAKLSSKNCTYLMSPSRDGCTITVSIDGPVLTSKLMETEAPATPSESSPDAKKELEAEIPEELVVVAFRLLVGSSTTDSIPGRVYLQGRHVKLKIDTKRWYDLPLTTEEIVMGVRNGFVSLGFGVPFEAGHNPVIDALEVYAVEKKKLHDIIPQTLDSIAETSQFVQRATVTAGSNNSFTNRLVLTLKILSSLYQIVSASLDQDTSEGKSLKSLIKSTALCEDQSIREGIEELLEGVESDCDVRQKFLDEGAIIGMSEALQTAYDRLLKDPTQLVEPLACRKLKTLLVTSLRSTTSIALSRPENYVTATEQLALEGLAARSIALDAAEILLLSIQAGPQCRDVLERVVHLLLAELSISKSHTESAEGEFATFGTIAKLLRHSDSAVVERCCEAITSFVTTHTPAFVNPVADLFNACEGDRIEQSAPIAYQCDSCSLFPITDTRYTLLEDDHDIDLCTKCYQVARVYAEQREFSANSPLIINGRSIGGASKLSCSQMNQMKSVPIADGQAIAVRVEQARQQVKSTGVTGDTNDPLRRALLLSHSAETPLTNKIVINFDTLTDGLFDNILGHVGSMLDGSNSSMPIARINPLLTLLLDSIRMGGNENAHISRGKRYAREVMKHTRRILGTMRGGARSEKTRYVLLINLLRSLSRLTAGNEDEMGVINDEGSESGSPPAINPASPVAVSTTVATPHQSNGKTDPRFVCAAHGVPAVRRRCSDGVNKNKRFYVCGMERKQRCKYFKWAEESKHKHRESAGPPTRFEKEMEVVMWQLLSDGLSNAQTGSLNDQLCDLLEAELSRSEAGDCKELGTAEVTSSGDQPMDSSKVEISSIYDCEAAIEDLNDGVFCSLEKVRGVSPLWLCKQDQQHPPRELLLPDDESDDQKLADKFIEASLDLVSAVASTSSTGKSKMPGQTRWFSLLCEVISMNPPSRFRVQAKRALKLMCGRNRTIYHSVRDYYVFGFQFKEVLHYASSVLDSALCVREQARQCGDHWKENEVSFNELPAGGLLGTLDLISEDSLTLANSRRIGSILDQLMSVAKSRGANWRFFCSLLQLPPGRRQRAGVLHFGQERVDIEDCFGGPPILSLFWLSCVLSGPNQVKVMKLIDSALAPVQERTRLSGSQCSEVVEAGDEATDAVDFAIDTDLVDENVLANAAPQRAPEATLLKCGEKSLSVSDIVAFSLEFILRGRTAELRRVASLVSRKLCRHIDDACLVSVFTLLVDKPMAEIGGLGCASVQYLQLLQTLVALGDPDDSLELSPIAQKVAQAFVHQMNMFKLIGGKSQSSWEAGRESSIKRFDLGSCVYCHRVRPPQKGAHGKSSTHSKEKKSKEKSVNGDKPSTDVPSTPPGPPWLPEQVRPFTKGRLEPSTDNTCSSEFALYVQLKCRLSIAEVHASVTDPRGRFAKTIVVYFTPRPVFEVNQLKTEDYEALWQECGTITMGRGTARASCTLPAPVTAANLKFEYRDFHDRAGGSRPADGAFVLFCPRCSRQVNNAHGVCGNCGECVFQCRRCRHIQYDRPDAFLCTECGHCSSGTFSFELTAGVASNAVAIVDDESHARIVKVSRAATKLYTELQTTLVDALRTAMRKRSLSGEDPLSEYSPALKRALMGDLPKLGPEDDAGTAASNEARPALGNSGSRGDGRPSSSAVSRAQSLFRLARQLQSESGSRGGGRTRELFVREAFFGSSREFSLEDGDGGDEGADIVGLLSGGNNDRDDPLTRLVATISGRRAARNLAENARASVSATTGAISISGKRESGKSTVSECEKLSQLMREAERECHELQRRLQAWSRLERDSLPETAETEDKFTPTKCSRCAGPVTLHILLLILSLFQAKKIKDIKSVITKGFIRSLFLEPVHMHKDLFELKRMAVTTFCTESAHAAMLVLDELSARLKASNDGASAAILGKLLEHAGEFPLFDKFISLATDTLKDAFVY